MSNDTRPPFSPTGPGKVELRNGATGTVRRDPEGASRSWLFEEDASGLRLRMGNDGRFNPNAEFDDWDIIAPHPEPQQTGWVTIVPGDESTLPTEKQSDCGGCVWGMTADGKVQRVHSDAYRTIGIGLYSGFDKTVWHPKPEPDMPEHYTPPEPKAAPVPEQSQLRFALRINTEESTWLYWSNNTKHGAGWRDRIDENTIWDAEDIPEQLRIIEDTAGGPTVTLHRVDDTPPAPPRVERFEAWIDSCVDSDGEHHEWTHSKRIREVLPTDPADLDKLLRTVREVANILHTDGIYGLSDKLNDALESK